MITSENYQKAKQLFHEVKELPADLRSKYLDENCADKELTALVNRLITASENAEEVFEAPAIALANDLFAEDWTARKIGNYQIESELGRGGMGIVFLASRADDEFRQKVALKIVQGALNIREIRQRFRMERQILADLEHNNIARLLDGGTTEDGLPFFVMEYVDGVPITDFCREQDLDTSLKIFREACGAVEYAHRHLVVHRDIKPSNILMTSDGVPKLLDFGIAKLVSPNGDRPQAATQYSAMTPDYASPEQLRGESVSTATDVYSLGVVLRELLVGKERDLGKGVSRDLRAIVETATREETSFRYASVERLSEDIGRLSAGMPVRARANSPFYRLAKFVKRRRLAVGAGMATLLILLAGVFAIVRQANIAAAERDRAQAALAKAARIDAFLQQALGSANPMQEGREVKVVDVLDKAAKRAEVELSNDPEVLAQVQRTIGVTYYNLEIYDKSEPLLRSAAGRFLEIYGGGDIRTAAVQKELGDLLSFTGKVDEAIPLLTGASSVFESAPDKLQESLDVRFSLSQAYYFKGENKTAEAGYRNILEIADRSSLQNEMIVADVSHELANLIRDRDDLAAIELYERSSRIVRPMPDKRMNLGTCLSNLGMVLTEVGRFDEARKYLDESLMIRREIFGEESPAVAVVLTNVSRIELHRGDAVRAERTARQAVSILEKALLPGHRNFGPAYVTLGQILLERRNFTEAASYLDKGLAVLRSKKEVRRMAVAESVLGECLVLQNKRSEGLELLRTSYDKLSEQLGETHPRTTEARERLARIKAKI
jgi:serine/threonine-protein kinase